MTEKSLFWYTDGFVGDIGDGAAPYTQEEFRAFNAAWAAGGVDNQGILYNAGGALAVSGSSSPLSVADGWAFANGFPHFIKTTPVSLTVITPGAGDTGGRVVLRVNFTAQTVRATVVLNTDGNSAIPSLTQSAGVTWDIPLATFVVDTSGNIWTDSGKSVAGVTDAREYAVSPLSNIHIGERQGGDATDWDTAGSTTYDVGHTVMQAGVRSVAFSSSAYETDDVTFPSAFGAPPIVMLTPGSNINPTEPIVLTFSHVTETGFKANLWERDGSAISEPFVYNWIAIGPAA